MTTEELLKNQEMWTEAYRQKALEAQAFLRDIIFAVEEGNNPRVRACVVNAKTYLMIEDYSKTSKPEKT